MGAPVVWFEIAGRELPVLERFYGQLFGWRVKVDDTSGYGGIETGAQGGIPGGMWAPGAPTGEYVSFYVGVTDIDAALGDAERLGGSVAQQVTSIADGSRIAMFLDPEGHRIGLVQSPPGAR